MTTGLPDAPWIRDAEMNGFGDDVPDVECPICGKVCETIFKDAYGDVCGCDNCIIKQDSWEWDEERRENEDHPEWD